MPHRRHARAAQRGAVEAGSLQAGANATQRGDARYDTADFNDRSPANLRVDYLLPEKRSRCAARDVLASAVDPRPTLVWGSPPRARITGWCGWTSVQAQLDAHRAVIRQPVRLRILVVEDHAHEGFLQHVLARSRPSRMLSMYSRYSLSRVQGMNFSRPG
jgi:hypothetical protein